MKKTTQELIDAILAALGDAYWQEIGKASVASRHGLSSPAAHTYRAEGLDHARRIVGSIVSEWNEEE